MTEEPPSPGDGETVDVVDDRLEQSPNEPIPRGERYKDEDWLYQQYTVLNKSIRDLADACDVWPKTIQRWLDKYDIETRSVGRSAAPSGNAPWRAERWLRREYREREKSVYEIADEQGCDEKTIRNWLAEHEIPTRSYSERHPKSREDPRYRDEAWLREQYIDRQRSGADIAAECGVGDTTIYRWLDRHGIETRSTADARQLSEARYIRITDDGEAESDPADQVQQTVGKRTYEGPLSGLDMSQQYLAERDGEMLESPYRDEEWLRERYAKTGSASDIAALCDVDRAAIYYWMDKYGIERSQGNEDARYRDEDWLREAYADLGSLEAVGDACGVSSGTIRNWLVRFDIDRNPDATSGQYPGGRPEKTLDDLLDAVIKLRERTGEWPNQPGYEDQRQQLPDAPSTSWFYDKNPGGLSSWPEVIELAKRAVTTDH